MKDNPLKEWRKRKRLSQRAAALMLNVTVNTLVNWESGTTRPTPRSMATITLVTHISSVQWLTWMDKQQGK